LDLIKRFEAEDAFSEHEPLLDILFPEDVRNIEEEILVIKKERQAILHSFFVVARNIKLTGDFSSQLNKVIRANAAIGQIQNYVAPIKARAKNVIAPSGEPFLDEAKGQQMEDKAIEYTKDLEKKRDEFFAQAREFIAKSIE
jgi:hypothetical protein